MHVRFEELKGVWKSHFECLMNEKTVREAIVSSMDKKAGGKRVCTERN